MMKRVLFSLSVLWTIIGLGSSSPVPGSRKGSSSAARNGSSSAALRSKSSLKQSEPPVCKFSISPNFNNDHISIFVDLECDNHRIYDDIKECEATVAFDLFLDTDKSTVKSQVSCLTESVGVAVKGVANQYECLKSIVRQRHGVVYDVIQYGVSYDLLNERLYTAIIPTYGEPMSAGRKGNWMMIGSIVEFRFGSADILWYTNLRFEPKRADRIGTTVAFPYYRDVPGEIETVDAKKVAPKSVKDSAWNRTTEALVLSPYTPLDLNRYIRASNRYNGFIRDEATYANPYVSLTGATCKSSSNSDASPRVTSVPESRSSEPLGAFLPVPKGEITLEQLTKNLDLKQSAEK